MHAMAILISVFFSAFDEHFATETTRMHSLRCIWVVWTGREERGGCGGYFGGCSWVTMINDDEP